MDTNTETATVVDPAVAKAAAETAKAEKKLHDLKVKELKLVADAEAAEIRRQVGESNMAVMQLANAKIEKNLAEAETRIARLLERAESGLPAYKKGMGRPRGIKNGEGKSAVRKALVLPDGRLQRLGVGRPPKDAQIVEITKDNAALLIEDAAETTGEAAGVALNVQVG